MLLHLSRLRFASNRERYTVASDVRAAHRFVMSHFPHVDGDPRAELGVLWRFEDEDDPHLLVQSLVPPTTIVETKAFDPGGPENGTLLRFRVVANPSVKKKREGRRNSARVGIRGETDQLAWLEMRLAGALAWSDAGDVRIAVPQRHFGKGKQRVVVDAVGFDGVGHVVDHTQLAAVIANGVGPAKAFGCGLLSIARA